MHQAGERHRRKITPVVATIYHDTSGDAYTTIVCGVTYTVEIQTPRNFLRERFMREKMINSHEEDQASRNKISRAATSKSHDAGSLNDADVTRER